jgi:hypothetical protein
MSKLRKQVSRLLVELVRRLVDGALSQQGSDEYTLLEGAQAWITVRNLSVWLREADEGLVVDVYPLGRESDTSIGSTWVTWEEAMFDDHSERIAAKYEPMIQAVHQRVNAGELSYEQGQDQVMPLLANWRREDPDGPDGPDSVVWLVCPKPLDVPMDHYKPFKETKASIAEAGGYIECEYCGLPCIGYATPGMSQPEPSVAVALQVDGDEQESEAVKTPSELVEILVRSLGYSALAHDVGAMSYGDYDAHRAEVVRSLVKLGFDELGHAKEASDGVH